MILTTPFRLTILHLGQRRFIEDETFIILLHCRVWLRNAGIRSAEALG
jgi:hypothetical protein